MARYNFLKVGGNKSQLLERIQIFFVCNLFATKIQSYVRRHFVKQMFRVRGPALGQIKECVNETDFYTLEPLIEIPKQELFSYCDFDGFIYGFNINSFIYLLKMKRIGMVNPYNRNDIPGHVVMNAIRLYSYMIMYMQDHIHDKDDLSYENTYWMYHIWRMVRPNRRRRRILPASILGGLTMSPSVSASDIILGAEPSSPTSVARADSPIPPPPLLEEVPRRVREFQFFRETNMHDLFGDSDSDTDHEIPRHSPARALLGRSIDSMSTLETLEMSVDIETVRHVDTPIPPLDDIENTAAPQTPTRTMQTQTEAGEEPINFSQQLTPASIPTSPSPPPLQRPVPRTSRPPIAQYTPIIVNIVEHLNETMRKLQLIRANPVQVRIRELFMEIDQLGNYTDIRWFQNLNRHRYYVLYGNLFENWRYRSRLAPHIKFRICPIGDPFQDSIPIMPTINDITEAQLIQNCLIVMENMVYTAYDIEDRKLGAFQVLTALTAVSEEARQTLPWLYESMYE